MIQWKDKVAVDISYQDYVGFIELRNYIRGALSAFEQDTPMFNVINRIDEKLMTHSCEIIYQARDKFGLPE